MQSITYFFGIDYIFLTLTLASLAPITSKPSENQQNFGVSDDYESLNMQNKGTSTYEETQKKMTRETTNAQKNIGLKVL